MQTLKDDKAKACACLWDLIGMMERLEMYNPMQVQHNGYIDVSKMTTFLEKHGLTDDELRLQAQLPSKR